MDQQSSDELEGVEAAVLELRGACSGQLAMAVPRSVADRPLALVPAQPLETHGRTQQVASQAGETGRVAGVEAGRVVGRESGVLVPGQQELTENLIVRGESQQTRIWPPL